MNEPEASEGVSEFRSIAPAVMNDAQRSTIPLREIRQTAEREAITAALLQCNGQVPAAAKALRISRAQLYRLIGRLGLRVGGTDMESPAQGNA